MATAAQLHRKKQTGFAWLRCLIEDGMFSTEKLIKIGKAEFFVSSDHVNAEKSLLRVLTRRERGTLLALIPTEYGEVVEVRKEDVVG